MTAVAFGAPTSDGHISAMPSYCIRDLQLSPAKLEHLWRTLEGRPSEFSAFEAPDPDAFQAAMFDGSVLWFEIVDADRPEGPDEARGLIALTLQEMDPNATVSMTLLDRRGPDKIEVFRAFIRGLFDRFPLHRVSIEVPRVHFALRRLVEHAGLPYEGKRRDGVRLKDQWVTVNLYGVLRHEVEAWH